MRISPLAVSHCPDARSPEIFIVPEQFLAGNARVITFSAHGPTLTSSQEPLPWGVHIPCRMGMDWLQVPHPLSHCAFITALCEAVSQLKLKTAG